MSRVREHRHLVDSRRNARTCLEENTFKTSCFFIMIFSPPSPLNNIFSYKCIHINIRLQKNKNGLKKHYTKSVTVNKSDIHKRPINPCDSILQQRIKYKLNQNTSLNCLQYISLWVEHINKHNIHFQMHLKYSKLQNSRSGFSWILFV